MINNQAIDENFYMKPYATALCWAGIIGFAYSLLFLGMDTDSFDEFIVFPNGYASILFSYYIFNSFLVLSSGLLLRSKNKIGIFTLMLVFVSVFGSLLIPSGHDLHGIFLTTIVTPTIFFGIGIIGPIFFVSTILINIFRIKHWWRVIYKI